MQLMDWIQTKPCQQNEQYDKRAEKIGNNKSHRQSSKPFFYQGTIEKTIAAGKLLSRNCPKNVQKF